MFRERRNLRASAGVSPRRQALYRRVGEFGAGARGAVVQAERAYKVPHMSDRVLRTWGHGAH